MGPIWNGPVDVIGTMKEYLDILADEITSLQSVNNMLVGHINAVAAAQNPEELLTAINNLPDDAQEPIIDLSAAQAEAEALRGQLEEAMECLRVIVKCSESDCCVGCKYEFTDSDCNDCPTDKAWENARRLLENSPAKAAMIAQDGQKGGSDG